jgi:hypothetical protein
MKRPFTLFSILAVASIIVFQTTGNQAHSNASGAPAGNTGSPADAQTCARSGCHSGTALVSPVQIISSNIPAGGYVPGTTYTISATVTSSTGSNKFGFQISPQGPGGVLRGTPVITNPTTTKIVLTKYITHTTAGNTGVGGTKTWSFDWVAPVAGTGDVTFYGAFNYANGNGTSSGDQIFKDQLTVIENTGVGINEIPKSIEASVFPNPAVDHTILRYTLEKQSDLDLVIMDASGRVMQREMKLNGAPGTTDMRIDLPSDWPAGLYRIHLTAGDRQVMRNIIKQ